jgi:hypothetical protein
VPLPATPIRVVYHSDACGESYVLSQYFDTLQLKRWQQYVESLGDPVLDAL